MANLSNLLAGQSNLVTDQDLATVATSGSYADLTNKPTIPTVPTLATVATTGSYADLTNKPTIPTVPTLATVATTGSYADLTNKPTIPTLPTLATVATTGSYTDLIDKPTIVTALSGLSDVSTAQLTVDEIYLPAATRLNVTNNGAGSYSFDQYSTSNPTLFASGGNTIAFNLNVPGHPFLIQTSTGTNYDTGLVHVSTTGTVTTGSAAQGQISGTLYWKIPSSISGNYKYRCSIHAGMTGVISVAPAQPASGVKTTSYTMTASGLNRLTADMAGVIIIENTAARTAIYLPDATTLTSSSAMFQIKMLNYNGDTSVYTYNGTLIGYLRSVIPGYSNNNATYSSLTNQNVSEQRMLQEFYTFNCVDTSTTDGKWTLGTGNLNGWSRISYSQYSTTNTSFYEQSCWRQLTPTLYLNVYSGPNPYNGYVGAWQYNPSSENFTRLGSDVQIGSAQWNGRAMCVKLSATTAWISTDAGGLNYIATVSGGAVTLSNSFSTSIGTNIRGGWYISDNKVLVSWRNSQSGVSMAIATVSGTSVTFGNEIVLSGTGDAQYSGCSQAAAAVISSTRVVVWVLGSTTGDFTANRCEVRGSSITISNTSLTVDSTVRAFPSGDQNSYPSFDSTYGFNNADLALDTTNKLMGCTTNNYYYGNYSGIYVTCNYSDSNSTLSFSQTGYTPITTNYSRSWTAAVPGTVYFVPLASLNLRFFLKSGSFEQLQTTAVNLGFTPEGTYQGAPFQAYFYDSSTLLVPIIQGSTQVRMYVFKTNATPGISS